METTMDETEMHAEEMIRYMKKCPVNGITEREVAIAYLRRERIAGEVEASKELGRQLFGNAS